MSSPKRDIVRLEISLVAHEELVALGLEEHVTKFLGEKVQLSLDDQSSSSLSFIINVKRSDLDAELIGRLSLVRRAALSLPLLLAMEAQEAGKMTSMMRMPLRRAKGGEGGSVGDVMYVQGHPDRVTVVLATSFEDPSDITLGKVFMQVCFLHTDQ